MGTSGVDLLFKILGFGFFGYLIWIFLASGIATSFLFNTVPSYVWAIILFIILVFVLRKK